MKARTLAVSAAVLAAFAATPASASFIGDSVDFTTSQTGTTTITGGAAGVTVGAGTEFAACVGPNGDGCATSGMFIGVDMGIDTVTFQFVGSTFGTNGSFSIVISNINDTLTSVASAGGPLLAGTFGLASFTDHTMTFTGSTDTAFNAVGGVTFQFTTTVPEPDTLALAAFGLAGLGAARRRRAK